MPSILDTQWGKHWPLLFSLLLTATHQLATNEKVPLTEILNLHFLMCNARNVDWISPKTLLHYTNQGYMKFTEINFTRSFTTLAFSETDALMSSTILVIFVKHMYNHICIHNNYYRESRIIIMILIKFTAKHTSNYSLQL